MTKIRAAFFFCLVVFLPYPTPSAASPDIENDQLSELIRSQKQQTDAYRELNRNYPAIQSALRFLASPELSHATRPLLENPQRMKMLYANIGWLLFFTIFRSWRMSKLTSSYWLRTLLFKTWSTLVFFFVSFIIIPYLYLGSPYFKIIADILKHFY